MRTILSRALAELNARQSVMLVTIVAEQGSAPRGPGSQMLVGADGQLTGTIGGGQVERQSELLALSLLKERRSQMQHFALTQAGADSLGMACGGDVTVLFQFISPEDTLWQSVLETALAQLTAAQPGWLILRTDGSAPAMLDGEGMALLGSSGTAPLSKRCILTETDFSLPLPIGERAVIFGAGHLARALVPLLRSVEFRPVVYDDRPALADPAAFPDAEQVVCGEFRNIAGTLPLSPEDYVVVMTAGHLHDLEIQEQILRQELAYVGVIGSRAKIAAVNARLREAGISEEKLRTVHTPVGTPIKAVTPAEIAVSILRLSGASVDVAVNGRDAVDKFAASLPGTYDFILMDIQMPEMNGRDATRAIRKLDHKDAKTIPIFALSADAFVEDQRLSIASGMNGHFSKPIDFEKIRKEIGRTLKEKK